MVFGIFLMFCNLILPVLMLLLGISFLNSSPGKINRYYGYRTKRSMLNQDTWDFAHKSCGRIWKRAGAIMLPVSIVVSIPIFWMNETMRGILTILLETIQILVMVGSIALVERKLKREFDENGNPLHESSVNYLP